MKLRNLIPILSILVSTFGLSAQNVVKLSVGVNYDSIASLDGSYFAVKSNGKWGVVKDNKQVLACEYDRIDALGDDVITFVIGDKVGFADVNGKVLLSATYPYHVENQTEEKTQYNLFDKGACVVSDNGVLKLINKENQSLLSDELTIVSRVGDAVIVKQNGLYGMVNSKGQITVHPQYISLETIVPGKLYVYQVHGKNGMPAFGLVDGNGAIKTIPLYEEFRPYKTQDGILVKAYDSMGKQGLFDEEGEIIMQPLYQVTEPSKIKGLYNITDNLKKGVIGADYKVRVKPDYDDVRILVREDTFFVATSGLKSIVSKRVTQKIFETEGLILDIFKQSDGSICFVVEQDLFYGVCTSEGKWLIEPQYDEVLGIVAGKMCVRKGAKWGAIDMNNNVVVDFKYEKVKLSNTGELIAFFDYRKGSKILNSTGSIIDFPKTDELLVYGDYVEYKVGKKKERLYSDGRKIPAVFLALGAEMNGILCAKTADGWGYFDSKTFESLTDKTFDAVGGFVYGIAYAAKGNEILVLNTDYSVKQSLQLPAGVNKSLVVSSLTLFGYAGKTFCSVRDVKTNKVGVITINK